MLKAGNKAPGFFDIGHFEDETSLSQPGGKKVVVFFFPRANTAGCTLEAKEFAQLYGEFSKLGAEVMGVSTDSAGVLKKFSDKLKLPYRLVSDPDHKIAELYGVWREKKLYGKSYMGTVRSTFVIDVDGTILKAYDRVKAARHARQVLEDIIALDKG